MLTYLVKATEGLLPAAVLLGFYVSYAKTAFSGKGKKVMLVGLIAGLALGIVIGILNNTTNRIDNAGWYLKTYIIALAAFIAFVLSVPA